MIMTTLRQFIAQHKISMSAGWADSNPNMADMPRGSSHWKCVLRCCKRQMTVPFSMGPAHSKEPTVEDILSCCASDSATVENTRSFEDFADALGYDPDSRKAERIYEVCKRQAESLKRLLGPEAYETLLWDTEQL
jgi:hypothetical protein